LNGFKRSIEYLLGCGFFQQEGEEGISLCPTLQTFSKEKHQLFLLLLLSAWVCFSLMSPMSSPSSSLRSNEPATPTHATHPSQSCSTTAPPAELLLCSGKNGLSTSWPARTWPGLTQSLCELPGGLHPSAPQNASHHKVSVCLLSC